MHRHGSQKKKIPVVTVLAAAVVLLALTELLVGSSGMSVRSCVLALLGQGDTAAVRIMRYIRLPRLLAAVIAGAGLSAAGLVMQTVLGNPMASPATLGVSNAAVFGANLSIVAFAGGFLSTGNNLTSYTASADPFATSALAFLFAAASVLVILALAAFGVAWYLTDGDLAALPQRLKTLRLPEWVTLWQAHEPKPGARLI